MDSTSHDELPEGWTCLRHDTLQKDFYFHEDSRTVSWTKPYTIEFEESPESHTVVASLSQRKRRKKEKDHDQPKPMLVDPLPNNSTVKVILKIAGTSDIAYAEVKEVIRELEDFKEILHAAFPHRVAPIKKVVVWRRGENEFVEGGPDRPECFPLEIGLGDRVELHLRGLWVPSRERRNDVMLLTELCENVLKTKLEYTEDPLGNGATGFRVAINISGKTWAHGEAGTKKVARQNAAPKVLAILLPELFPEPDLKLVALDSYLLETPYAQVPHKESLLSPTEMMLVLQGLLLTPPEEWKTRATPTELFDFLKSHFSELQTWGQFARLLREARPPLQPTSPTQTVKPQPQPQSQPQSQPRLQPPPRELAHHQQPHKPLAQVTQTRPARTPADLAKESRPNKPNQALLDRLKQEMKKL